MRSKAEITHIANGIYAKVAENINRLEEVRKEQVASITGADFQGDFKKVINMIDAVEAMLRAGVFEGTTLPGFVSKCETAIDDISMLTLTVRAKNNATIKYSKRYDIPVIGNADLITDIASAYLDVLYQMFYQERALENIKDFNQRIAELCGEYEVPCMFKLNLNLKSTGVVESITDDCVVLNATVERALDLKSLEIFQSTEGYSAIIREEAISRLMEKLKSAETPVQVLKARLKEIEFATNTVLRRRVDKLIRETHHVKAVNLLNVKKGGVGYFEKKVKVDGVETDIFALVRKTPQGEVSVSLTPFNRDLMNVEYDVLADVYIEAENKVK